MAPTPGPAGEADESLEIAKHRSENAIVLCAAVLVPTIAAVRAVTAAPEQAAAVALEGDLLLIRHRLKPGREVRPALNLLPPPGPRRTIFGSECSVAERTMCYAGS